MVCEKCGAVIKDEAKFCGYCGTKVNPVVAPIVEEPVVEETIVEEPIIEEAIVEEPVADNPDQTEQEERTKELSLRARLINQKNKKSF